MLGFIVLVSKISTGQALPSKVQLETEGLSRIQFWLICSIAKLEETRKSALLIRCCTCMHKILFALQGRGHWKVQSLAKFPIFLVKAWFSAFQKLMGREREQHMPGNTV